MKMRNINLADGPVCINDGLSIIIHPDGWEVHNVLTEIVSAVNAEHDIKEWENRAARVMNCLSVAAHAHGTIDSMSPFAEEIIERNFNDDFFALRGPAGYVLTFILDELSVAEKESRPLVCIEYPETALHILVQEKLSDILYNWSDRTGIPCVIYTQSPNIISGHYDEIIDYEDLFVEE